MTRKTAGFAVIFVLVAISITYFSQNIDHDNVDADKEAGLKYLSGLINHEQRPTSKEIERALGDEDTPGEMRSLSDVHEFLSILVEWDEQDYKQIEKDIFDPLVNFLRSGTGGQKISMDNAAFINGLPNSILAKRAKSEDRNKIKKINWSVYEDELIVEKELLNSLQSYREQFKKIDDVDIVGLELLAPFDSREDGLGPNKAMLRMYLDFRGLNTFGDRRHDRGEFLVDVYKSSDSWKIKEMEFINGESLVKRNPSFVEQSDKILLTKKKNYVRKEAIRRGGYALALEDINKDGLVDMFVGSMGESELLMGQKNGQFKTVDSPVNSETLVKSAIFADFNNSGQDDLLVVRFEPSKFIEGLQNEEVVIYENKAEQGFVKKTQAFKDSIDTQSYDHAMPAAVADFNNDGLLDFYVGFPGSRDFTFMRRPSSMSQDRQSKRVQGLYMNDGHIQFYDLLSKQETGDFNSYQRKGAEVLPHSALAADYNQNGLMDLLVVDDIGNLSPMYQNLGQSKFLQSAEKIGISNHQVGMSVALGDYDNSGEFDILMTNVNFHALKRMQNSSRLNYNLDYTSSGTDGLRLFKASRVNDEVVYQDITKQAGLDMVGEGLAGVEFIDYNNDGLLDIYVKNGLWSGTSRDKTQDLSSLFSRMGEAATNLLVDLAPLDTESSESSSFFMRILQSFKGDAYTSKEDRDLHRPSLAGFQRNRLFRNQGDGSFLEVGYLEGVDSLADGYIVAKADVNNDGLMDMVLRNADPGSQEVNYKPVQLYINNNEEENKSVILTLEGSKSNYNGVGAILEAKTKKRELKRQLIGNNGTAQSQKIVHFGLGKDDLIDELTIYWPSGHVQTLHNLKPGRHHIVESSKLNVVSR